MDGITSAFLYNHYYITKIRKSYKSRMSKTDVIVFQEFKYENQDEILKLTRTHQKITFVDCCPREDILETITKRKTNVTILDHHESSKPLIDKYLQEDLINGLSYIGASASLITYSWFNFNQDKEAVINFLDSYVKTKITQQKSDVPFGLKLVNSWDVFDGLYVEAEAFRIYFDSSNFSPDDDNILSLLEDPFIIQKAITQGNIMINFFDGWRERYLNQYGYAVQYQDYTFLVLNIGEYNSKIFGDKIDKYDAVIVYCYTGDAFKCSMYSTRKKFNCARFCQQFGGGGHMKAAGFYCDTLPDWLKQKVERRKEKPNGKRT